MKFFTYPGAPNPMRLELMLKYKGLTLDNEQVDLRTGAQLAETYRSINPRCTVPALLLDDGTLLTEVIAICLYLDSQYPDKPVFGSDELERALVVNWMHRIFTEGFLAAAEVLRNSSPAMKDRALPGPDDIAQIPQLAERGRLRLPMFFANLDAHLKDRDFIVGDALSQADIDAWVVIHFGGWVKIRPGEDLKHLAQWQQRVENLVKPT